MPADDILKDLNEQQKEAVIFNDGPCLIIAGPGSGKTRALTSKIAYLLKVKNINPENILAVTFTNKAAKEMKERVESILKGELSNIEMGQENLKVPSFIGTFHSIAARLLRVESKNIDLDNNFVIFDTQDSEKLIKDILISLDINIKEFNPKSILGSISRAKNELVGPASYKNFAKGYYLERVAQIYPLYQAKLKENNALDFSDLLFFLVKLFKEKEDIKNFYQNKFKHILVDEYQDTNKVQYEIIKTLSKGKDDINLTVVGDVSQSIYSWRGADYRNMMEFQNDFDKAKLIHLAKNYRSTKNILLAAKNLIENNSTHMQIDLFTDNIDGPKINLFEANDEKYESNYVVSNIIDKSNFGLSFSDFAVLYRTNAQSRILEEAFISNNIPYRIIGGVRFYDRKEIKDVLAYLRVFYNPKDTVSFSRCINTPPRGIGPKTLSKIAKSNYDLNMISEVSKIDWQKYIDLVKDKNATPLELLDVVLDEFRYLDYLDDGTEDSVSRIENIKELRTVAKQYDNLEDFLETITLVESSNKGVDVDTNQVTLMTMHAAKGLEFDTVFVVGLEEGIFPHSRSMADPAELEEERRLCYVAITRAKNDLHLTYTRRRTYFGNTSSSIISRFISEIPEEIINFRLY